MNGLQIDINTGDLLVERSAAVVADASGFIAELVLRSVAASSRNTRSSVPKLPLCSPGSLTRSGPATLKRCSAPAASMF